MHDECSHKHELWDLTPDVLNHVVSIQMGFTVEQSHHCSHCITATLEHNKIPQYFHLELFISLQFSSV